MNKVAIRIILAHIIIGILAVLSETYIFNMESIPNTKSFDKALFTNRVQNNNVDFHYLITFSYYHNLGFQDVIFCSVDTQ